MPVAPAITIVQPNSNAPFTYNPMGGAMITVSGTSIPTPDGGSVQVSVWIENPSGGKLYFAASAGGAPGTWTVNIPVPQGGGGRFYVIGARIQWNNSVFPGAVASATDQILVQLN